MKQYTYFSFNKILYLGVGVNLGGVVCCSCCLTGVNLGVVYGAGGGDDGSNKFICNLGISILLISSSLLLEWKFSIWLMNFSSSNKKDLNGSCFVILVITIFSVVGATAGAATTAGWTGVICSGVSTSGGKETPTPVSDGMKSGGGSLGSRYGAGTEFFST